MPQTPDQIYTIGQDRISAVQGDKEVIDVMALHAIAQLYPNQVGKLFDDIRFISATTLEMNLAIAENRDPVWPLYVVL